MAAPLFCSNDLWRRYLSASTVFVALVVILRMLSRISLLGIAR